MRIVTRFARLPSGEGLVLALGNFDGVHLGHQHLLREMVTFAKEQGAVPGVLLFDPHPRKVLFPERPFEMLLDLEKKLELISRLGVEVAYLVPFDLETSRLEPEQFVREVLVERLCILGVFVGFNYRFGRGAAGTPEDLRAYGERYGFAVRVTPPVTVRGLLVSSTAVRSALREGDIARARLLLGYWPVLAGRVSPGDRRGASLGFPTANLALPEDLVIPRVGVYAGRALLEGESFPAVLNIGTRPTFGEGLTKRCEVHMIGYRGAAYGKRLEVELYRRLRDERKFRDGEELARQIARDVEEALEVCKNPCLAAR